MDSSNYASRLPFEIWRECFLLLSLFDHRNLSGTCRFFYDICLPFVFKSISYSSNIQYRKHSEPKDIDHQLSNLNKNISRMNAVSSDPRLAPLVRAINLHYSLHLYKYSEDVVVKAAKDAYGPFVQTFVQAVTRFVNLRQVNIDFQKNMDKAILTVLASLPHLDVVLFTSARFSAHTLKPRLKLKTLVIDNTRLRPMRLDPNPNSSAKLLDIVSVERLECIQSYSWTNTPKLFRALTRQGISSCLVNLTFQLRAEDVDVLYPFLVTCPNLLYLSIDSEDYPSSRLPPLPPLPQSTIPRLKYLRCPCAVAEAFVPGRAIIKLWLTHPSFYTEYYSLDKIRDIIPKISQIAGHLITLDIQNMVPFPDAFGLITTHLPRLQKLRLGFGYRRVVMKEDPNIIDLETVVSREELLLGIRQADTLGFKADVFLLPIDLHAIYMVWISPLQPSHPDFNIAFNVAGLDPLDSFEEGQPPACPQSTRAEDEFAQSSRPNF